MKLLDMDIKKPNQKDTNVAQIEIYASVAQWIEQLSLTSLNWLTGAFVGNNNLQSAAHRIGKS